MQCEFISENEKLTCKNCGFSIVTSQSPKRLHRKCDFTQKKEYPSIFEMTTNAIKAGVDFIKDGFKVSNEEEEKRRIGICKECPLYVAAENRCLECGCYLSFKNAISSSHCPIGKW